MKKRAVACILAVACVASLAGCSKFDGQATLAEVGDTKITADVANFYARYQQAQFETTYGSYLGDDIWSTELSEGQTYEESFKESIMESLETMYVLDAHKDDYNVSLSDTEEEAIDTAAKEFTESNDSSAKEAVSGDEDTVKKVLELITIQKKMNDAMTADVDTEVSDDEAAQKKMQYVFFSAKTTDSDGNSTDMTDDEKSDLKKSAEEFQKKAAKAKDFAACAEEEGYTATDLTFDSDTTSPSEDLIKAADELKEGEVTEVIETDNGYYVAKLESLLDRDATDTKKESIVSERKSDQYKSLCDEWKKDADIKEHKKVWKTISFAKQGVTVKTVTEDSTDSSDSSK